MDSRLFAEVLRLRRLNFNIYRTDVSLKYCGHRSGKDVFDFTCSSWEVITVPVMENNDSGQFLVQTSTEQWVSLEDFLSAQAPPLRAIDSDAVMANFWNHTGKHFRLMDLPAELRCNIYKHALFPTSAKQSQSPYRLKPESDSGRPWHKTSNAFKPNAALLRVSRNVSAESLHLLYGQGEFYFTRPEDCNTSLMTIAAQSLKEIRYLTLNFSHMGYFRFFGARLSTHLSFIHAPALELIVSKIEDKHFEELTLFMPHPSCIAGKQQELCDKNFPCPKTVVDWILVSILPWLQDVDLKKFRLRGCVKESQCSRFTERISINQTWEKQWEEYCRDVDSEVGVHVEDMDNGGVGLEHCDADQGYDLKRMSEDDEDDLKADIASERGELNGFLTPEVFVHGMIPPMCFCATLCSLTGFTTKD